jgi:hypothetical protein
MSKHVALPTSRLICFGAAKVCTNAVVSPKNPEDQIGLGFPQ